MVPSKEEARRHGAKLEGIFGEDPGKERRIDGGAEIDIAGNGDVELEVMRRSPVERAEFLCGIIEGFVVFEDGG